MSSLFIGLGGTGLEILGGLKDLFSREGVVDVQFLGIDVGEQDIPENLSPYEKINLKGGDIETIIDSDPWWAQIEAWYPFRSFKPRWKFTQGAYQLRLMGRLALWYNYDKLYNALQKAFQNAEGPGVEVFVIASTSGGTGSGLFRDMPGIINAHGNRPANLNLWGLLVNVDVVDAFYSLTETRDRDRIKHNAVSLFAELDLATLYRNQNKQLPLDLRNGNRFNGLLAYNGIFIVGKNNNSGISMDEKSDYINLSAYALNFMHQVSQQFATDVNWSGIDQALGSQVNLTFPIEFNYRVPENEYEGKVQLKLFDLPKEYISFGTLVIEFPEDEVRHYLRDKIYTDYFHFIRGEVVEEEKKKQLINSIIEDIQESENQDRLIDKAKFHVQDLAEKRGVSLFKKFEPENLKRVVYENLQSSEDFKNELERISSDFVMLISHRLGKILEDELNIMLNKKKERINTQIIQSTQLNIYQKDSLLEELASKILLEITDLEKNEEMWLQSENHKPEKIKAKLVNEIEDLQNQYEQLDSKLLVWKKKEKLEDLVASYLSSISTQLIDVYFKAIFLSEILHPIKDFYQNLLTFVQQEIQKIKKEEAAIEQEISVLKTKNYGIPNSLQNIKGGKGKNDFIVQIGSKGMIDKYIYEPERNKILNVLSSAGIRDHKKLFNSADEEANRLIIPLYLEKVLEWESKYFLEDLKISVILSTGEIREKKSLIRFVEQATSQEFDIFFSKYRTLYQEKQLRAVVNQIKNFKGSELDKNKLINELIEARLSLAIQTWTEPFVQLIDKPEISDAGRPNNFQAYRLRVDNGMNARLSEIIGKYFAGGNTQDNAISPNKAVFVNTIFGFSISNTLVFNHLLNKYERQRVSSNLSILSLKQNPGAAKRGMITFNPDANKFYHNDVRFAIDPDLFSYTSLFELSPKRIIQSWHVILLIITLDKMDYKNLKIKTNIPIAPNIMIPEGIQFNDLTSLYRFFYILDEGDFRKIYNILKRESDSIAVEKKQKKLQAAFKNISSAVGELIYLEKDLLNF